MAVMSELRHKFEDGTIIYYAGIPKFKNNFSRDVFVSGLLARDWEILLSQLILSAKHQGQKKDPQSGEEPGKIHHEIPGVVLEGLSTKYNACDVTALFLIAHRIYQELTGDYSLAETQKDQIERAVAYILSHLKDDVFIETPELSGGKRFALWVTYWKDSVLLDREGGEPFYPVVYPLAHAINISGVRSAAEITASRKLKKIAERMVQKLETMFDKEQGTFPIAIDERGPIHAVSSDALHMLYYLEPGDIPPATLKQIIDTSKVLETPLGYRTLEPEAAKRMITGYHAKTVWPFEQALIHRGAKIFGLNRPLEITERILEWITDSNPELFELEDDGRVQSGGCDPQLWTIAAKSYFSSQT